MGPGQPETSSVKTLKQVSLQLEVSRHSQLGQASGSGFIFRSTDFTRSLFRGMQVLGCTCFRMQSAQWFANLSRLVWQRDP